MPVNKVIYGNRTLIDISGTTANAASILKGFGCFGKDGNWIDGTASSGGGSLPAGVQAFQFGKITVSADIAASPVTYNHNLGVVPDLILVWANGNIAQSNSMLLAMRSPQMGYRSSAYNSYMAYHTNNTTSTTVVNSNNAAYGVCNMTANTFGLASAGGSYYWRKGTYQFIALKFQ